MQQATADDDAAAAEAAIAHVLDAQAGARADIEAARLEAAARIEAAREDARRIAARAGERLRGALARHEQALRDAVARIDADAPNTSTADVDRARLKVAIRAVALDLTGGPS